MEHTRFVGLDIHKERISISVAESGRSETLEYLGELTNDPGAISKLCDRLKRAGKPLAFCYEAGPCGYGVYQERSQKRSSSSSLVSVAKDIFPFRIRVISRISSTFFLATYMCIVSHS
jgi:hypothetical protein